VNVISFNSTYNKRMNKGNMAQKRSEPEGCTINLGEAGVTLFAKRKL